MLAMGCSFVLAVTYEVAVTATVPTPQPPEELDTIVIFRGLAYPGSDVTVRQDGTVLASVTTDPQARFDVSIEIDPGVYTFSIFGEDIQGREGRASNFTLSLTQGTTTTVSGIFLGPTIDSDGTTVAVGDTITILGITVPNSEVNVFISSTAEAQYKIDAGSDGSWSKSFLAGSEGLEVGSHTGRAKAVAPDDSISEFSKTINFEVTAAEEPDECAGRSVGDINCDRLVNLVDFSILLYYWNSTNPAQPRADINQDGTVNITDFSIMLYYWTG